MNIISIIIITIEVLKSCSTYLQSTLKLLLFGVKEEHEHQVPRTLLVDVKEKSVKTVN